MAYYDEVYKKNLDLGNGLVTTASYDANGRLVGASGEASVGVAGWQPSKQQGSSYGDRLNTGLSTLEKYNKYKDSYADDMRSAYEDVSNFSYKPDADQDYQNYLGSLQRQSQSAQKQTMSNLTGISGGRNNSWASAATAQVGQSYAAKGADAQADFADRAYQRLMQRYNLVGQMSDREYGRKNDMFNRQSDMVGLYNQLGQQEYSNTRQDAMDADYFRNSNQAYNQNEFNYGLDRQYLPQEREYGLQNLRDTAIKNQQAIQMGEIDLAAYPEQIQIGLKLGYISVDQANAELLGENIDNKYKPKLYDAQLYNAYGNFKSSSGGGGSSRSSTSTAKAQSTTAQTYQQTATDKAVENALKDYADQNGMRSIYNIPEQMVVAAIVATVQDDSERDRMMRKYKISNEAMNNFMRTWGSR